MQGWWSGPVMVEIFPTYPFSHKKMKFFCQLGIRQMLFKNTTPELGRLSLSWSLILIVWRGKVTCWMRIQTGKDIKQGPSKSFVPLVQKVNVLERIPMMGRTLCPTVCHPYPEHPSPRENVPQVFLFDTREELKTSLVTTNNVRNFLHFCQILFLLIWIAMFERRGAGILIQRINSNQAGIYSCPNFHLGDVHF